MLQPTTQVGAVRPQIDFPSAMLLLAWTAFVVYGSLVPLDFHALAWDQVARDFLGRGDAELQLRSLTDWTTNIAIFVPAGFFGLATLRRQGQGWGVSLWSILLTLVGCILLSLGIEFTQIFFPPRDSSALDVMANAIGAALGIVGWLALGAGTTQAYQALARLHHLPRSRSLGGTLRTAWLGSCGLLIAGWGGLFSTHWLDWDAAIARLVSIRVLPFLEHQAADIGLALLSTVFATMAYAPLGAVFWLLKIGHAKPLRKKLFVTAIAAAGIALLVEAAKLFLLARNPDTGNIAIAGLAAGLGYFLAPLIAQLFAPADQRAEVADRIEHVTPAAATSIRVLGARAIALVCAMAACALVVDYPMDRIQFAIALLAYSAILVRYPTAWLLALPALLPVLDLAPWSGRFFVDEFDGFVLATLAVGLWQAAGRPLAAAPGRVFWWLAAGFSASFLLSAVIGLLPLQPLDANALASPYSHYAALRLAKGLVFAVGLAVLLSSHTAAGQDVKRALGAGMVLGLATAAGSVIWERFAYVGLANFTADFRVVGLFSTMHTGGAHLDAFLVTALPFAAAWAWRTRRQTARVTAALLCAAGIYAVMMTFSRAAVGALAIEILVIAAWALLSDRQTKGRSVGDGIKLAAGLALAGLVISPVILGSFMQSRFATSSADLEIRTSHWSEAVGMMTDNWNTALFGMGLGRYPESYLLLSGEKDKPAVHRFETETGNTFLRIQPGATLYIEQIVSVQPGQDYQLGLKARATGHDAAVNVLLCDRTFLQGFGCQSATLPLSGEAGKWQPLQARLNSANVGANRLRLAKLSLENASPDRPIDIDDVALIDSEGVDHLVNGSFQAGADRWYFSSPYNHLPWHIKNLWLEILFEQGWVGLLVFCALVAATIARLAQLAWRGKAFAAVLLAGLMGFLAVGAFDSMFDAPRLSLGFGLLIAAAGIVYAQPQPASARLGTTGAAARPHTAAQPAMPFAPAEALADRVAAARPGTEISLAFQWRTYLPTAFVGLLVLTAAIVVVTRLPFIPYRIRELPNLYHPVLAPVLLAAFIFWVFGLPAIAARWLSVAQNRGMAYPLLVAGHGLLGWTMIQFAVLPDSIHTVIGSPELSWPLRLEDIARFVPLISVLFVFLTGGALIAAAMTGSRMAAAPVWWLLSAAVLLPIQYWVVVTQAATDNLVELMADSASFGSFMLLTAYLVLVGVSGSLLASLRSAASQARIGLVLASLILSLPLGYLLLTAGTEAVLVKDNKAFSAFQSVLSTDRAHYAVGLELWIRLVGAHLAAICITALTQYPLWQGFQPRPRRHRRRK